MGKKYAFILLSILLTLSICLPINTYAGVLKSSYITDFSRDIKLCDGAREDETSAPIANPTPSAANSTVSTIPFTVTTDIIAGVTTISGTGTPGNTVTITVHISPIDVKYGPVVVDAAGNWTISGITPLITGVRVYIEQDDVDEFGIPITHGAVVKIVP